MSSTQYTTHFVISAQTAFVASLDDALQRGHSLEQCLKNELSTSAKQNLLQMHHLARYNPQLAKHILCKISFNYIQSTSSTRGPPDTIHNWQSIYYVRYHLITFSQPPQREGLHGRLQRLHLHHRPRPDTHAAWSFCLRIKQRLHALMDTQSSDRISYHKLQVLKHYSPWSRRQP